MGRGLNPVVARGLEAIRADRDRGASALAAEAVRLVGEAAALGGEDLDVLAAALEAARPSMVAVGNAVRLARERFATAGASSPEGWRAAALALVAEMDGWRQAAARTAALLVSPGAVVATLSFSCSVCEAIEHAAQGLRSPPRVLAGESRPRLEGREAARRLAGAGMAVTVLCDGALVARISQADLVLVGADAVLADGTLVHKAGTFALALGAREAGVPVYAVADRTKLALGPVADEADDPDALWRSPPPGVVIDNPLFDRTPAALLAGVATERGLVAAAMAAARIRLT